VYKRPLQFAGRTFGKEFIRDAPYFQGQNFGKKGSLIHGKTVFLKFLKILFSQYFKNFFRISHKLARHTYYRGKVRAKIVRPSIFKNSAFFSNNNLVLGESRTFLVKSFRTKLKF